MASTSTKKDTRRPMHVHILYTLPPLAGTTFARSRTPVLVKAHAQAKGCKEKWGSCELGEIVKAVCATSSDLLPSSRTDHSLFIQNPKQTHRESLYPSDPSQPSTQPIEVNSGLVGWALDDASTESHSMIMGILRKDEVEEGEDDDSEDEAEEWLEVRMRLVKADPISHAQHLSQLSAFQQGLPFTSPSKRAPQPPQPSTSSSTKRAPPSPAAPMSASTPMFAHSPAPNAFASSSTSHLRNESEPVFKRPRLESGDSQSSQSSKYDARRPSAVETPTAIASSTPAAQEQGSPQAGSSGPMAAQLLSLLSQASSSSGSSNGFSPEMFALLKKLEKEAFIPASDEATGLLSSMLETAQKQAPSSSAKAKGKGRAKSIVTKVKDERAAPASDPVKGKKTKKGPEKEKGTFLGGAQKKVEREVVAIEPGQCAVCGRTKSNVWRAKDGNPNGPKMCNACGLYWNKNKADRPQKLWGNPDASPVRRVKPDAPMTDRDHRVQSRFLMTSPAKARAGGSNHGSPSTKKSPFHTMTSPVRGKNGWDFKAGPSSHAGDKLKALTQGGTPSSAAKTGEAARLAARRNADPTKKDESPRKALKRMLSVGGEVELRRLKGPLSDDDSHQNEQPDHHHHQELTPGARSPFKSHRSRTASNLSSGGGGLVFEDEDHTRHLHASQTEVDQDWMGSDFSTLFDLDAASTAAGPLSDAGYGTDIDMALDHHSHDGGEGLVHLDSSEEPTFNLQLSSDTHHELLSQTMFTSSPNSSHQSLSQHGGSSPLTLPFDFSSLPPSSPPVIPPGLFSSPPGEDELLDLESPIFSILGATPTAEEVRSTPGSTTKHHPTPTATTSVPSALSATATTSLQHVHDPTRDMSQYINSPPQTSSPHDHASAGAAAVAAPQDSENFEASFHAFFANHGGVPSSSSTQQPSSVFDPALLDTSSSVQTTSPPTEPDTKADQAEFMRLFGQCQEIMGRKQGEGGEKMGVVPGSDAAEPSWVTD